MVLFLTHLFGGPNHYTGPNMLELHKNMHIPRDVYDRNWGHMESAFLVYKLDKALIAELKEAWYTTKNDVCSKKWFEENIFEIREEYFFNFLINLSLKSVKIL